MSNPMERFRYPFAASTVLVRRLIPALLGTLGAGFLIWGIREFYFWRQPWLMVPLAALALLSWAAALDLLRLLPEIRTDATGVRVRRWGLFWRITPWEAIAGVQLTAEIDLLGWTESFYTIYAWRTLAGRRGRVRRPWHRRRTRLVRFSGHILHCDRLLAILQEKMAAHARPGPPITTSEP